MHHFRASTFLTPVLAAPLALIATGGLTSGSARAATSVSTSTTTPLVTASAGDVTVASGGTITVAGQPVVTVNSGNSVTIDSGGTLASTAANNGGGILVNAGTTATIANAGAISVAESYTVDSLTGTSTASGPIANTTGRYGIWVNGVGSGSISNSGSITVKGLGATGILLSDTYTGTLTNTGAITVKGDGAVGVSLANVVGDVSIGGSVSVVGSGAQGLVAAGDVSGAFVISGTVAQAIAYTTDASTSQSLSATQLRTGQAVVEIAGNLAKGVQIYAPCTVTTVNSVASCTSTGSATTTGAITAYANNPALLIGGSNGITLGAGAASVNGGTYSLAIDGTVTASASFSATDSHAVVIGGAGGTVSLPGGIGINGTITATAVDATATALQVNPGATVTALTNTGTIKASLSQAGGTAAYAIRDLSGTLTSVTNSGTISASAGLTNAAVDLSANTTGVSYTQALTPYQTAQQTAERAASTYSAASAVVYVSTVGNIYTGTGNDTVAISSGTVTGDAWLGGGADSVALSGDAAWTGSLHFGTGSAALSLAGTAKFKGALDLASQPGTLTIADSAIFAGSGLTGSSALNVVVNGGSFGASKATTLAVNALTVAAGGTITAYIDSAAGTSSLIQATTATFASGAKVAATISSLANAAGTYHVLTAGTLSGNPTFSDSSTVLPVLFKGSVAVQGNDIYLTIARKNASELGLTSAQGAAYEAIYANALNNTTLGTSLLEVSDTAALQGQINGLLPDHAGGMFDFVTRTARLTTRHLTDDSSLFDISGVGGWVEPVYFRGSKYASGTSAWTSDGFGLSLGVERKAGLGNLGLSFAWIGGTINNGSTQRIKANTYELGAFWRLSQGPLYAFAKVAGNRLTASSTRTFTGAVSSTAFTYEASGRWSGWAVTSSAGASYKLVLPGHLSVKPMAILEYANLYEKGYQESGSTVIDLAVNGRSSQSLTARTTLTAGWSLGDSTHDNRPFTVELEGGRRNQLAGHLGSTTAAFDGGSAFTITPDALKGGWLGEVRVLAGGFDYTWQLTGAAEKTLGKTDLSLRASLSMAF